ncbi:UNVERIFIED_CONTAM: hypothetical protein K2H54_038242 [Gekko kuhli]
MSTVPFQECFAIFTQRLIGGLPPSYFTVVQTVLEEDMRDFYNFVILLATGVAGGSIVISYGKPWNNPEGRRSPGIPLQGGNLQFLFGMERLG